MAYIAPAADSDETGSPETVLNHFHIKEIEHISSTEHLFFSFPSYFWIYQLNFSVF